MNGHISAHSGTIFQHAVAPVVASLGEMRGRVAERVRATVVRKLADDCALGYSALWEEPGGPASAAARARIAPLVETATLECGTALRQLRAAQKTQEGGGGGGGGGAAAASAMGGGGDDDDDELEDVTAAEAAKKDEQRAAATIEIGDDDDDEASGDAAARPPAPGVENVPPPVAPLLGKVKAERTLAAAP